MIFTNGHYFIKNLEKNFIRSSNILLCLNNIFSFTLILLIILGLQKSVSEKSIFNIYYLGLFFDYKSIKKKLENSILVYFIYFFLSNIEKVFFNITKKGLLTQW